MVFANLKREILSVGYIKLHCPNLQTKQFTSPSKHLYLLFFLIVGGCSQETWNDMEAATQNDAIETPSHEPWWRCDPPPSNPTSLAGYHHQVNGESQNPNWPNYRIQPLPKGEVFGSSSHSLHLHPRFLNGISRVYPLVFLGWTSCNSLSGMSRQASIQLSYRKHRGPSRCWLKLLLGQSAGWYPPVIEQLAMEAKANEQKWFM